MLLIPNAAVAAVTKRKKKKGGMLSMLAMKNSSLTYTDVQVVGAVKFKKLLLLLATLI